MQSVTQTHVLSTEWLCSLSSTVEALLLSSQVIEMIDRATRAIREMRCVLLIVVCCIRTCTWYKITSQTIVACGTRVGVSLFDTKICIVEQWSIRCCTCIRNNSVLIRILNAALIHSLNHKLHKNFTFIIIYKYCLTKFHSWNFM